MNHRDPKESKGQVERLARAYHRRFYAAVGSSLTVEDLEQEFWIVWTKAKEHFDPSKGFDFKAFLGVSIRNRMLVIARENARQSHIWAISANTPVGDNEEGCLLDLVEDKSKPVESVLIERNQRQYLLERIDPRLRKMLELIENTPAELEREVEAAQAKASFAASRGLAMKAPREITLSMLSEIMGVSRCSRYRMIDKIQDISGDDE